MTVATCGGANRCNAFLPNPSAPETGRGCCRANPPTAFLVRDTTEIVSHFPPMMPGGWCRQYEAAPTPALDADA